MLNTVYTVNTVVATADPSIAYLKGLPVGTYQTVEVLGYSAQADGGGGVFWWNATDTTPDNGSTVIAPTAGGTGRWNLLKDYLPAGTGAVATTVEAKLREWVSLADKGGVCDGATDDSAAFQAAVNTGKRVRLIGSAGNTPYIKSAITFSTPGQIIEGDGIAFTQVIVDSAFNLAAQGVFIVATGEPGPEFRDLWIKHAQPDTNVYANLIAYPPSVYMQGQPRVRFSRVRISNAKTCIDARGNSGGSNFIDCELSHYDYGIRLDGSVDTIKIINPHFWSFGNSGGNMTANQLQLYQLATNIAIDSGRCDDLKIISGLSICGLGMNFYQGAIGSTFGSVSDWDFDSFNGIKMSAGDIRVSNSDFTHNVGAYQAVAWTGGHLTIVNPTMLLASSTTTSLSFNSSNSIPNRVSIIGGRIDVGTNDQTLISETVTTGGLFLDILGVQFSGLPQNSSPANPIVKINSGHINFQGNTALDKGTGTGNLIAITSDDYHIIKGNQFMGWGASLPSGYSLLTFEGNAQVAGSAWQAYTPTITASSGTFTSVSATGRKRYVGNNVMHVQMTITIVTNGTAAGSVVATLPGTSNGDFVLSGRDGTSGKSLQGVISPSGTTVSIFAYDNTYPGADGHVLYLSGTFEYA